MSDAGSLIKPLPEESGRHRLASRLRSLASARSRARGPSRRQKTLAAALGLPPTLPPLSPIRGRIELVRLQWRLTVGSPRRIWGYQDACEVFMASAVVGLDDRRRLPGGLRIAGRYLPLVR
jgi:hypothetical protein